MYGPSTSSGLQTSNFQVYARPSMLQSIITNAPTTGLATLTVYDSPDGTTAGRTILALIEQFAGTSSTPTPLPSPVVANKGIYCTFSGTGANYIIHYSPL